MFRSGNIEAFEEDDSKRKLSPKVQSNPFPLAQDMQRPMNNPGMQMNQSDNSFRGYQEPSDQDSFAFNQSNDFSKQRNQPTFAGGEHHDMIIQNQSMTQQIGQPNHAATIYQPQSQNTSMGGDQQNQSLMSQQMTQLAPQRSDISMGVASSFRDLMELRKIDPPQLEVCEPQIKSGGAGKHHVYKIKGLDHQGIVEIFRRFKHFFILREVLFERFLGLYIPPIPQKKSVVRSLKNNHLQGNKDNAFVEERCFFLDLFIKEICKLPYLYESAEFQAFIRTPGDVEKALSSFQRQSTDELLARFRQALPLNEAASEYKLKEYNNKIGEFVKDCREFIEHLKKFKKQIKIIVPIKEQERGLYKDFVEFLIKYEELNVKKQTPEEPFQANLLANEKFDFKAQLQETSQNLKNPFKHIRNWVKTEIMELGSLMESISRKEGVEAMKLRTMNKVKDRKDTVDKLSTGKFTFKGLFKSKDGKAEKTQEILQSISQGEKDIQNFDIIKNYLIIYLAEIAIPAFKNQKAGNYVAAMQNFCQQELSNTQMQHDCWNQFMESIKRVQIK